MASSRPIACSQPWTGTSTRCCSATLPPSSTGFLLTAIPNWTGRLPVQGLPLLGLVLTWLAGRLAIFFSAGIGPIAAAAVDCAFLLAVAAAATIEIVAGRNWRNLKVLVPLAMLLAANVLFHIEAHLQGSSDISRRLGFSAALVLIMIIGGRDHPELHPQLACARESGPPARSVQPIRRRGGSHLHGSAIGVDGFPRPSGRRSGPDPGRWPQHRPSASVGRRQDGARPVGVNSARRLCLRADRIGLARPCRAASADDPGCGRPSCNRSRRDRHDDVGYDDARHARAHRAHTACRIRDPPCLPGDRAIGGAPRRRRFHAVRSSAAPRISRSVGRRVPWLRRAVRPDACSAQCLPIGLTASHLRGGWSCPAGVLLCFAAANRALTFRTLATKIRSRPPKS